MHVLFWIKIYYTYNLSESFGFSVWDFLRWNFERNELAKVWSGVDIKDSDCFFSSIFPLDTILDDGVEQFFSCIEIFFVFSLLPPQSCNIWVVSLGRSIAPLSVTIAQFWALLIDGTKIAAVATGAAANDNALSMLFFWFPLDKNFFLWVEDPVDVFCPSRDWTSWV